MVAIASKTLSASLEAIYLKDHARGSKTLAAWSLMKLIVVSTKSGLRPVQRLRRSQGLNSFTS